MFQKRNSLQKPSSDLIAAFNKSFPVLPQLARPANSNLPARPSSTPILPSSSAGSSGFMSFDPRQFGHFADHVDPDTTPGGTDYPTSAAQDDTSGSASAAFQYGSYLDFSTPAAWQHTPGSGNYYPQAQLGPQYTWPASFQPGLPTPSSRSLSLPSSTNLQQPAFLNLQDVHLQPTYHSRHLDFNPTFQQPFSPPTSDMSAFRSRSDAMNPASSSRSRQQRSTAAPWPTDASQSVDFLHHGGPSADRASMRFHVSLINGTAMVKEGEIPVSYLNKRQTYKVRICDTRPQEAGPVPTTYRTFIRVSFHEDKQRAQPDQHWQLWKEGRGMNEAQQHGGKLQAVEHVPLSQSTGHASSVHVERESFDGFCVVWTAPNASPPECEVQFRCNFLSTDFSRSKGVKGIPVRLCAKNEVVSLDASDASQPPPEICYCKIKLFRDHGAERKLTNDESAIRRLIGKTEEQMKQSDVGNEEDYTSFDASGKRRAGDHSPSMSRPKKMARTKRSDSVSSENSSHGPDGLDGDLPAKIATLSRLLRSKQDITVFFLRGEATDDPDLHPVSLLDSPELQLLQSPELKRAERRGTLLTDTSMRSRHSLDASTNPVSPTNTKRGLQLPLQLPTPVNSHPTPEADWGTDLTKYESADVATCNAQHSESPAMQSGVRRASSLRTRSGLPVQVVDVNPGYEAPPEPLVKPVACFYARLSVEGREAADGYFRAIYLYDRSVSSLTYALAQKQDIDGESVVETIFVSSKDDRGLEVLVDDDMVSHIPEGQDMTADFTLQGGSQQRMSSRRVHGHARYTLRLRY